MFGTDPAGRGGIAATVAAWGTAGWFAREGVRYIPSHADGPWHAKLVVFVQSIIGLIGAHPRIVHVHAASNASFFRKALLLALARALGCRTVFHLHGGGFEAFSRRHTAIVRYTLQHSDAVLALSNHWAAYLRTLAPGANVSVLPNAVKLPVQHGDVREGEILFLGRLDPAKGVSELIDAVALLAPDYPALRLVLAGSGDLEGCARHAVRCGIADKVLLPGWIDPGTALRSAAIFCLPSHAEGLPLALLEAMAAGKPVVASAVGAIPEALAPDAGLLVPPRDVAALASALARLLDDPRGAAAMGKRARAVVAARYEQGQVGASLSALYRQLASQ